MKSIQEIKQTGSKYTRTEKTVKQLIDELIKQGECWTVREISETLGKNKVMVRMRLEELTKAGILNKWLIQEQVKDKHGKTVTRKVVYYCKE